MTPEQQIAFTLAAVLIAAFSLVISAVSLGWNIYRDIILKPRLKMGFVLCELLHPTFKKQMITLSLSATNIGPGEIKCNMIMLRESNWWRRILRKTKYAMLLHDYENPLSGQLPAKLGVGEAVDLLIRYQPDCFLGERWTHIGLKDSFGRLHWASSREVAIARKSFKRDFVSGSGKTVGPDQV